VAGGLAQAESLPADAVDLLLGAVVDNAGPRGIANLDVRLGKDIVAFANGEFANQDDWQAMAGLKMRW
jgi:hypothetical protein